MKAVQTYCCERCGIAALLPAPELPHVLCETCRPRAQSIENARARREKRRPIDVVTGLRR